MTFATNKHKNPDSDEKYHAIALGAIHDELSSATYSTLLELFVDILSEVKDSSVDDIMACLSKCREDLNDHVRALVVSAYRCARF